ncbi:MAG: DNA-3-methyladenine glycosylase [Bacteroidetes bacterium]|nr:DNA-3-methyladenine glycosylase [Bacteroidota bacterium]
MRYPVLPASFYRREDVVLIARELLGKVLVSRMNGEITSGIIRETEAYAGVTDRASHAYGGRYTERTRIMYREGGVAYIYLCYGIHSLFNVVTHEEGVPHAILIRGIMPAEGIDLMRQRIGSPQPAHKLGDGPGKVGKILALDPSLSGISLFGDEIWIEDRGIKIVDNEVHISERIGVSYAGEDAKLPYRFSVKLPENYQITI